MSTAAIVAAIRKNFDSKWDDDGDDFSAFKQLPSEAERIVDMSLNIRLRG
jgi:hypothetical protein